MTAGRFTRPFTDIYGGVAQALHWITALLVLAAVSVAWVMINMGPNNPWIHTLFLIHNPSA